MKKTKKIKGTKKNNTVEINASVIAFWKGVAIESEKLRNQSIRYALVNAGIQNI